jgi:hypothetical protein
VDLLLKRRVWETVERAVANRRACGSAVSSSARTRDDEANRTAAVPRAAIRRGTRALLCESDKDGIRYLNATATDQLAFRGFRRKGILRPC